MKRIAGNSTAGLGIYGISNRSLFALAKRWQIYTLEGDEGLQGAAGALALPAESIPYSPESVLLAEAS